MRSPTQRETIERFLERLGDQVRGPGRIYLVGGATAVLYGWRASTIDIDLKAAVEPPGLFEAIAVLKDELDVNVEIASPDQFIPPLPGWQERSPFVGRYGPIEVFHYDPYAQALAKLQRGHERDHKDLQALRQRGLIEPATLWRLFGDIEPDLIRYPAMDAAAFRRAVEDFCREI